MKKLTCVSLLSLSLFLNLKLFAVEATESKVWTSSEGKTMTASATEIQDNKVTMLKSNGKTVQVPLSMLSEADREFVVAHFSEEPEDEIEIVEEPVELEDKRKKRGKKNRKRGGVIINGPEESKDGSFYYHYVPTTVRTGESIPAIFWTGGGRAGNERDLQPLVPAAESTGTVLVACGNSSNSGKNNGQHINNNLFHAIEKFSLDTERLFFSGASGGGARALGNAAHYKFGGAMPLVGYIPGEKPPKSGFYYVVTGGNDYNRYASAYAVDQLGKNATLRLSPGGHTSREAEALNDGIIWLYSRNAYSGKASSDEIAVFETKFYEYLTEDLVDAPGRAYYWTDHLLNTCAMTGSNKSQFRDLHEKLESNEDVVKYFAGRLALEQFGDKYLAPVGPASRRKHTTKSIQKAAAKLVTDYDGVDWVSTVAEDLGKKTE